MRLPEPPSGEEVQVEYFYAGGRHDPDEHHERRLYAFHMTLGQSRYRFRYPILCTAGTPIA